MQTANGEFPTQIAGRRVVRAEDGETWVAPHCCARLDRAGIRTFGDVMDTKEGRCLRVLKDRENWYLRVKDSDGQPRGLFLKKHRIRTWSTWLRAVLGASPRPSAGRVEAANIQSLSELGIDVTVLAAYGEKLQADGTLESFLLTEELSGYLELQAFLRQRFPSPAEAARDRDLGRIIRQVAAIARRLHAAGYSHRDFYFCHLLINEPAPGVFDIRLIDLQRVQHRRWFRRRWIVKDLAQLSYSAPRDRIGCRDRLAFLRHYLGVRRLRPQDKRLIRAVLRKQRWMERKLGRHAWE